MRALKDYCIYIHVCTKSYEYISISKSSTILYVGWEICLSKKWFLEDIWECSLTWTGKFKEHKISLGQKSNILCVLGLILKKNNRLGRLGIFFSNLRKKNFNLMTETRNKWCGIKIKSDKKVLAMETIAVFGYIFVLEKK